MERKNKETINIEGNVTFQEKQYQKKEVPKNALYLGLKIAESKEKISDVITNGLRGILDIYSNVEDAKILLKQFDDNSFENDDTYNLPWRYPKDSKVWHITTLFKKGASMQKSHPAYTQFEQGKNIQVELKAIIYIPCKIITSVIFAETAIANEFPHMTTLLGTYAAKNSNDVCQELFGKGKPLEKEYELISKKSDDDKNPSESSVERIEIKMFNKKEIVYYYRFPIAYTIDTKMEVFFK